MVESTGFNAGLETPRNKFDKVERIMSAALQDLKIKLVEFEGEFGPRHPEILQMREGLEREEREFKGHLGQARRELDLAVDEAEGDAR